MAVFLLSPLYIAKTYRKTIDSGKKKSINLFLNQIPVPMVQGCSQCAGAESQIMQGKEQRGSLEASLRSCFYHSHMLRLKTQGT